MSHSHTSPNVYTDVFITMICPHVMKKPGAPASSSICHDHFNLNPLFHPSPRLGVGGLHVTTYQVVNDGMVAALAKALPVGKDELAAHHALRELIAE